MRLSSRLLLLALAGWLGLSAVALAAPPFRFREARHGRGELKYIQGLPVLTLAGSPEEIGKQQAALTADAAAPLMGLPKQLLQRHGIEAAWPLVVTLARSMLKQVPEDHRRELEAAVEASGLDRDVLVVGNAMLELRRMGGCSTVIVERDAAAGGPLFGRNFDFPTLGVLHEYSLVSVYRPEGKRPFVSVGFPGLGGVVSGMNDAGLSVATLDVYAAADGSPMFDPAGMPLIFCFRRILEECATVEEAEALVRSVKRTTWMNLAVCDPQGGAVFELTPRSVVVRRAPAGYLPCTNHFRSPELAVGTACWRYDTFGRLGGEQPRDLAGVARLLHAVNQGSATIQTMVFEPGPRKLHLSIGAGPASARPLTTLELKPLLGR